MGQGNLTSTGRGGESVSYDVMLTVAYCLRFEQLIYLKYFELNSPAADAALLIDAGVSFSASASPVVG